jgi:hypothetical protein
MREQMNAGIRNAIEEIRIREVPGGGFSLQNNQELRADATAWAILALSAAGIEKKSLMASSVKMANLQLPDGRIPIMKGIDTAFWPTPIAILAWRSIREFENEIDLGTQFLLKTSGIHRPNEPDSPASHDTSIRGWPWIENTHSWVEPTSLSIIALKSCGFGQHERTAEAVNMVLNRQLPSGGWNYGNTLVFGRELLPLPESTGMALCALGGLTTIDSVQKSLDYIIKLTGKIKTPLTLSWMIFGLGEWSNLPDGWRPLIEESLSLQERYGKYDTVLLSQLVLSAITNGKLLSVCT